MSDRTDMQTARVAEVSPGIAETHQARQKVGLIIGIILWCLLVIAMIVLSFFAHTHLKPLPIELTTSRDIQAIGFPQWVGSFFRFLTLINDPTPDAITVVCVLVIFLLFRWFWQGLFFVLVVCVGNGVDVVIGDLVGRPRPTPNLIHVDSKLIFNSFPSGHSCHMMVFYGFLLYLTFTRPIREWRYHWITIPFQVWAILNILLVGFARIWEGEHWFTDVLGGYLDGTIWLLLFIILYNLTMRKLQERREKRIAIQ